MNPAMAPPSRQLPHGFKKPQDAADDVFHTGWNDTWMKVRLTNENEWRMGLDFKSK